MRFFALFLFFALAASLSAPAQAQKQKQKNPPPVKSSSSSAAIGSGGPDVGDIESVIDRYQIQSRRGALERDLRQEDIYERGLVNAVRSMSDDELEFFAPIVYSFDNMSDRVLEMPELKQFKGKRPTRISPYMKAVADKYMDFMSPQYYYLLMPEAFPDPGSSETEYGDVKAREPVILVVSPQMDPERVALLVDPHGARVGRQAQALPFAFAQQDAETILPVDTVRSRIVTENSPISDADVLAFSAALGKLRSMPGLKTAPAAPDSRPLPEDACRSYLSAVKETPGASEKFAAILAEEEFDEASWMNMCLRSARAVFFVQFNPENLHRFVTDRFMERQPDFQITVENAWEVEKEVQAAEEKFKKMRGRMVFNPGDFNRIYPYAESLARAMQSLPDYDPSLDLKGK